MKQFWVVKRDNRGLTFRILQVDFVLRNNYSGLLLLKRKKVKK